MVVVCFGRAYCVDRVKFVQLADRFVDSVEEGMMKIVRSVRSGDSRHSGFGAVLTGADGQTSVFAERLEVHALGLERTNGL